MLGGGVDAATLVAALGTGLPPVALTCSFLLVQAALQERLSARDSELNQANLNLFMHIH